MFVEIDEWMDERIHIMKRLEELWEVMLCTSFAFGQMDWRQYAITYLQNHHMQSCKYYQTCIERCLVYLLHICIYIYVFDIHIVIYIYVCMCLIQHCKNADALSRWLRKGRIFDLWEFDLSRCRSSEPLQMVPRSWARSGAEFWMVNQR